MVLLMIMTHDGAHPAHIELAGHPVQDPFLAAGVQTQAEVLSCDYCDFVLICFIIIIIIIMISSSSSSSST